MQPLQQGPVWTVTILEDVTCSKEGKDCFFLTTIPLCMCKVHSFNWLWRGRGPEEKVEIKADRDTFATIQTGGIFFFLLLKDSMHKSQENQTYGSPNSCNSAPGRERARHKYNPAVHATYVQGGKLWVLWEPWFWMSWLVSLNSQVQYSG